MQVQVNQLSPVLVELDIEVAAERVTSELDKAFGVVSKSAKVKGFRAGKAPRTVLQQVYGARLAADVTQRLVDETFQKAVAEKKVQPITQPSFEPQKLVKDQPFSYKVRFEVIPQIAEVSYEGLKAKRPKVVVEEASVDSALEALRKEHATLQAPASARPAQAGDVVTVDFQVFVAGREVPDAGAQDFQLELGTGNILEAIEGALVGKAIGEQAEARAELPAQHPHPKLRGKEASFRLTLKDVKEKVLPALDDEFVKDIGELKSLTELRADLRSKLEARLKEQSDTAVAEQLVQALARANEIPVPPSLVQRQAQVTEQEILQRARSQGQAANSVSPELRAQVLLDSELKVRAGLLMAEVAKKEGVKIGDAEFEEGLKELAEQTGKNLAKLRVEYRDPSKREMLMGMILENKVLDILEAKAQIEEAD
jgi:trigger factor